MSYVFFQPNALDKKNEVGDCAVRSICCAENLEWLEAYDLMSKYAREVWSPFNCKKGYEHILSKLGYTYHSIGRPKKGQKRPTVESFAKEHKKGIFLPIVANHYVCIKNGDWYDTWRSDNLSVYGYWEKTDAESEL